MTLLVSHAPTGGAANGASSAGLPGITPDGTRVVFASAASNLVSDDTNLAGDVFLYERASDAFTLVSTGDGGSPAKGTSTDPNVIGRRPLGGFRIVRPQPRPRRRRRDDRHLRARRPRWRDRACERDGGGRRSGRDLAASDHQPGRSGARLRIEGLEPRARRRHRLGHLRASCRVRRRTALDHLPSPRRCLARRQRHDRLHCCRRGVRACESRRRELHPGDLCRRRHRARGRRDRPRSVCDVAGNCAVAGPVGPFRIDRRPPAISVSTPADAAVVTRGAVMNPVYACIDGGSGTATCAGPAGPLDTATAGHRRNHHHGDRRRRQPQARSPRGTGWAAAVAGSPLHR